MSPCPLMPPKHETLILLSIQPAVATQAQHTSRQMCLKTLLSADWQSKHTSFIGDKETLNAQGKEAHSLVSEFYTFRLLRRHRLSFILCLSFCRGEYNTDCLRCKTTFVSALVWARYRIASTSLISRVTKVVVMETGCKPAQSEAICRREGRYAMKSRHAICSHESLKPPSHIIASDWCISDHQVFNCPPCVTWCRFISMSIRWHGGNSFKY